AGPRLERTIPDGARSTRPRGRGECPRPPDEDATERSTWLGVPLSGRRGKAIQRTGSLLDALQTDVRVTAGGGDGWTPRELLNEDEVSTGVEQMRGETVAQAVGRVARGQPSLITGPVEDGPCRLPADGTRRRGTRKQPDFRLGDPPVGPQHVE